VDKEVIVLTQTRSLTFERTLPAAPKEVFRAFTAASALRDWLSNTADIDPRKGGRIYLWWDTGYYSAGVITAISRDESLSFTWRGPNDPESGEVSVAIAPHDTGAKVTVTHSGMGSGVEWAEAVDKIKSIWEDGLENLESVLQTGVDLRFARRPMFGLSAADVLNDEIAARLGVPVKEGLVLTGLADGMAAVKAGFQKDDVLVEFGGAEIPNFQALGVALQAHRAGDKVPAVFYRGSEKHTLTMELGKRPETDIPETPEAVAKAARALYEQYDAEIAALFEGVSEAEADYRPGSGEWSAKEVLGHLLAIERDTQVWITTMLEDIDVLQVFHTNENARIKALADCYATVPVLLDELRRNEGITVAMIEAVPPDIASRKHLFRQIAQWLTGFDTHTKEHIAEMTKLIEAARAQK